MRYLIAFLLFAIPAHAALLVERIALDDVGAVVPRHYLHHGVVKNRDVIVQQHYRPVWAFDHMRPGSFKVLNGRYAFSLAAVSNGPANFFVIREAVEWATPSPMVGPNLRCDTPYNKESDERDK